MRGFLRRAAMAAGAAVLPLGVALVPAALASAATAGCTTSGRQVTCVFLETGSAQTWTVPAGVTSAAVSLYGAQGGAGFNQLIAGGAGAEVTGTLAVTPGATLQVNVGQAGTYNGGATFGGGAAQGDDAGSGGGASDLRAAAADGSYPLTSRLLVAGGGGGAGFYGSNGTNAAENDPGGPGGPAGVSGGNGTAVTANGATLGAGGGGGAGTTGPGSGGTGGAVSGTSTCAAGGALPGAPGGLGVAGAGGAGGPQQGGGGGGGGGYYGGGGGGGGADDSCQDFAGAGGGGGGSSYTGGAGVSAASVTGTAAAPDGAPNGEIIIQYTAPPVTTSTAVTSSASPAVPGQAVSYTASVSPTDNGGTVTFYDGRAPVAGCAGESLNGSGQAVCKVTYSTAGSHAITAAYSGDAGYTESTSAVLTQQVVPDRADLSVKLAVPATAADGASVTETVTVTDNGPAPAGNIVTALTEAPGLTVTSSGGATMRGPILTWTTASLAPGASVTFRVTGQVGAHARGIVLVAATTRSATLDLNPFNNAALAAVRLG